MRTMMARLRPQGGNKKADPAPSRLRYRVQRWMLTPGIRFGLRVGVPVCLLLVAGAVFFAQETRRDMLVGLVNDVRASIETRPEFMVNVMAIDGAGTSVSEDVREVVSLDFPISSFDLDLPALRELIIGLDPVKSAQVRIRPGGILQVDIVERTPAVIWRNREGLALLDATGKHVAELGQRGLHADLPVIAGEGADRVTEEGLRLIAIAKPLNKRLRGLVRIGERRWDVVLDRDQRILLPSVNPEQALEQVLAVSQVQDLLERDVAVVDLRLAERPTVRMTENAVENWWRIRQINGGRQ